MTATPPPEGWYADPQARAAGEERWWNGARWTAHTRSVEPGPAPAAGSAEPPSAGLLDGLEPPGSLPDGAPLARVGPRLVAHAVDVALVVTVAGIVGLMLSVPWWVLSGSSSALPDVVATEVVDVVVTVAAWLGYQLAFRRSGATLGRRLLRLRVRPLAADGPLAVGQVLRRSAAGCGLLVFALAPGLPVGLVLLGLEGWRATRDELRRPWRDQVAGTVSIRVPEP